jgi:hypothetical protein
MYMLDIKKVYIDTRFKTAESKSDSDFFIELPQTITIPDRCVCYIDDIVIPVSWTSINDRNNMIYLRVQVGESYVLLEDITLAIGNYTGTTFASSLAQTLNVSLNPLGLSMTMSYDNVNNKLTMVLEDLRSSHSGGSSVSILAEGDVFFDSLGGTKLRSINGAFRMKKTTVLQVKIPQDFYLDLHTTRNLYLSSSSLGSYNTISNFGNDTIIKKIPVRYNYNEMLFDSSASGYDYTDVSKRSLRRIDFRLQDVFGNLINLNNNHWSFSLVFQLQD